MTTALLVLSEAYIGYCSVGSVCRPTSVSTALLVLSEAYIGYCSVAASGTVCRPAVRSGLYFLKCHVV